MNEQPRQGGGPDDPPPPQGAQGPEVPAYGQPPTAAPIPPAFCRACGQQIDARASICPLCGVAQATAPYAPVRVGPTRKDPGLAVLFSFLWAGAGHLYAGDQDVGLPLIISYSVAFLLSFTIILLVITIPAMLGMWIFGMIDSAKKATAYNVEHGLPG
jgi:hypothetical protein